VRMMEKFFDSLEVWYVPCLDNRDADHLTWIASSRATTQSDAIIEKLIKTSVSQQNQPMKQVLWSLARLIRNQRMIGCIQLRCSWRTILHLMTTPKSSV
jgi:hypothetical protein